MRMRTRVSGFMTRPSVRAAQPRTAAHPRTLARPHALPLAGFTFILAFTDCILLDLSEFVLTLLSLSSLSCRSKGVDFGFFCRFRLRGAAQAGRAYSGGPRRPLGRAAGGQAGGDL